MSFPKLKSVSMAPARREAACTQLSWCPPPVGAVTISEVLLMFHLQLGSPSSSQPRHLAAHGSLAAVHGIGWNHTIRQCWLQDKEMHTGTAWQPSQSPARPHHALGRQCPLQATLRSPEQPPAANSAGVLLGAAPNTARAESSRVSLLTEKCSDLWEISL